MARPEGARSLRDGGNGIRRLQGRRDRRCPGSPYHAVGRRFPVQRSGRDAQFHRVFQYRLEGRNGGHLPDVGQYLAQGGFRRRRFRREGIQTAGQGPRTAGGPLPRRWQARARQHHSGNHDFAAGRRSGAQTRSDHDASQGGHQQQRRGEIFGRRHLQRGVDGQGRRLRRGLDHDRRDQRQRNQVLRSQICGNGAPHGTYRIQRHHRAYDDGRADRLPEHSAGYRRKRRTQDHCRGVREAGRPAGNRS